MANVAKINEQMLALNDLLIKKVKLLESERAALRMMAENGLAMGEHGTAEWRDALHAILNMLNIDLSR